MGLGTAKPTQIPHFCRLAQGARPTQILHWKIWSDQKPADRHVLSSGPQSDMAVAKAKH